MATMQLGVILHGVTGYPYDATRALDWLGEVEALYQSAASGGVPIPHDQFLHYPDKVSPDWQPERLQAVLGPPR